MLLLPLLLWWARSPHRFSVGRARQLVCMMSVWAALAGTFAIGMLSSRDAVAENTGDALPLPSASVIREGTDIAPIDGQVVMLGRRWAFVPSGDIRPLPGSSLPVDSFASDHQESPSIRAGISHASIEPLKTTGSQNATASLKIVSTTKLRMIGHHSTAEANSADSHLADTGLPSSHPVRMFTPIRLVALPGSFTPVADRATQGEATDTPPSHMVLVENLMLQRIVQSIRSDASDDRWVLSGKVIEFFGENRMVIRTAQRSNAE